MKKLSRNPDVTWRVESHREAHVKEVLGDPAREAEDADAGDVGTVTILSGGVMHQLNLLGGEVWKLCDGTLDRDGLVSRLMELFDADEEILRGDVDAFLEDMKGKALVLES